MIPASLLSDNEAVFLTLYDPDIAARIINPISLADRHEACCELAFLKARRDDTPMMVGLVARLPAASEYTLDEAYAEIERILRDAEVAWGEPLSIRGMEYALVQAGYGNYEATELGPDFDSKEVDLDLPEWDDVIAYDKHRKLILCNDGPKFIPRVRQAA